MRSDSDAARRGFDARSSSQLSFMEGSSVAERAIENEVRASPNPSVRGNVAHLVEHRIYHPGVAGSIPATQIGPWGRQCPTVFIFR